MGPRSTPPPWPEGHRIGQIGSAVKVSFSPLSRGHTGLGTRCVCFFCNAQAFIVIVVLIMKRRQDSMGHSHIAALFR
jgi:hypothetical protein